MSEKPILFSGEMVRSIIAGRKTQTRRVIKPPRGMRADDGFVLYSGNVRFVGNIIRRPPVAVGDRLYVRETYAIAGFYNGVADRPVIWLPDDFSLGYREPGNRYGYIYRSAIVYIAGPMTGKPMFNYPAFYGMAGLIAKEFQCEVLNPARQPNGLSYEQYMERAFADLDRATVIVMLDGWQKSSGAKREFCQANRRGINILFQSQLEIALAAKLEKENPLTIKKDNTQK